MLRKIEGFEQERLEIQQTIEHAAIAAQQALSMCKIEEKDVRAILKHFAEGIDEEDRNDTKEILRSLIDRIVFDFTTLDCCIYYKIPINSRNLVASPNG